MSVLRIMCISLCGYLGAHMPDIVIPESVAATMCDIWSYGAHPPKSTLCQGPHAYADVIMELTGALEMLDEHEAQVLAAGEKRELLHNYLVSISSKKGCSSCLSSPCSCSSHKPCPLPCPPCNDCKPSKCLITGCFRTTASGDVLFGFGQPIVIIRNGANYTFTLPQPLGAPLSVAVTGTIAAQTPYLVGIPSDRTFTLTNLAASQTYCYIITTIG